MPEIVQIDDPADPRIADYRDIRERDLVGRRRLFVAEGRTVIEKLIAADHHAPQSLLVAAHRLPGIEPLIAPLPDTVPVFVAAQPVIDAIAGFPLHRGLLAIGRRSAPSPADTLLAGGGDVLVLCGIANHDNMGGIFRNAAAFGIGAVLLDHGCCDPLYRKAIRVSVGATLLVPFARLPAGEDIAALLDRHGVAGVALSPAGTTELREWRPRGPQAVLLGAEGPGLAPALMARMQSLGITMAGGFDSLNVATTSGIVLHHLAAARTSATTRPSPASPTETYGHLPD